MSSLQRSDLLQERLNAMLIHKFTSVVKMLNISHFGQQNLQGFSVDGKLSKFPNALKLWHLTGSKALLVYL